jgi:hypothetical protein
MTDRTIVVSNGQQGELLAGGQPAHGLAAAEATALINAVAHAAATSPSQVRRALSRLGPDSSFSETVTVRFIVEE